MSDQKNFLLGDKIELPIKEKFKEVEQLGLFSDLKKDWEKEWQGMPEFIQNDNQYFHSIIVHFRNRDDINAFAKLVNQNISGTTKFMTYPELELTRRADKVYVDAT